jgi:hypothetical protein
MFIGNWRGNKIMQLLEVLLFALSLLTWCFVGFSLKKQYRYATQIFDFLRLYPILSIASWMLAIFASFLLFGQAITPLLAIFYTVLTLVLMFYSVRWQSGYLLNTFKEFLEVITSDDFTIISLDDYDKKLLSPDKVNVFFRHDVDISLPRTLKMAKIQKEYDIQSTYFFRLHAEKYSFEEAKPIIKKLTDDGFKIGLHYETLNVAKGDIKKAIELFENDLRKIRELAPVHAVAAHGQRHYKNRDIWKEVDRAMLDISSAYDMKYDMYLSDAGGKSLRDKDGNYLFDRIYEAKPGQIVQVLIHPDWWI